jgi:hypothetical protein
MVCKPLLECFCLVDLVLSGHKFTLFLVSDMLGMFVISLYESSASKF